MAQQHTTANVNPAPELLTMGEVAAALRRTRSGIDKLRARDPNFPKPIKDGDNRRSRIYFVRSEIDAYLAAKISTRDAA